MLDKFKNIMINEEDLEDDEFYFSTGGGIYLHDKLQEEYGFDIPSFKCTKEQLLFITNLAEGSKEKISIVNELNGKECNMYIWKPVGYPFTKGLIIYSDSTENVTKYVENKYNSLSVSI